ncbi:mtDNA inheritance, partitioning of the mitochondrial organelle [Onygenales sp. PD_40]|nr:mtDNA inheritance, partitioning of the mitochondrial organelle [Onygenales sp. PD_40]KAK2789637.1 mtDNA inheritance, partitioning of the mitochondrial organelle [Onygenales sp. PD_12]KAK2797737.1 mtDNA inheritance, partitioning of the mitochondrial organelle [Onygenales sp. PD_10]
MHEIITLQLGQRSNYVATHFWNLQESYFTYSADEESPVDHDVHFRPGIAADGAETFTPRTVIYDLKGGFGALRQYNALYEIEAEPGIPRGLWDGNEVVQQQPAVPQTEYQKNLDLGLPLPQLTAESVRYWSDFNKVFYNPKSIVQLNEYELNSQLMPFEDWSMGEDLFRSLDREHDILDRDFRAFAEECDQLQGIQIFSGTDDAWGGFAARYVDKLKDEFGKKSIWFWGLEDGAKVQRQKQAKVTANIARSVNDISPQASAYVPIMDPPRRLPAYVNSDLRSEWYASALVSAAIESVTLPTRLRSHRGVESWLPAQDRPQQIFSLQAAIVSEKDLESYISPEAEKEILQAEDEIEQDEALLKGYDLDFSWSNLAHSNKRVHVFGQVQINRGFSTESNIAPELMGQPSRMQSLKSLTTVQRFHTPLSFPILDSFPHNLFAGQGTPASGSKLSVRASLSTTTQIGEKVKELQKFAARVVGVDEREALMNGLGEIAEAYQESWESESDSGDD